MRTVINDQYEYIDHWRRFRSQVTERLGEILEKRFSLPNIVLIENESDTRAVVPASHQDDEVLGCGGTRQSLVQNGAKVKVVYMTDGRFGNLDREPSDMIAIREREAREGTMPVEAGCF